MACFRRSIPRDIHEISVKLTGERALASARLVQLRDVEAVIEGTLEPLSGEPVDWGIATAHFIAVVRGEDSKVHPWCDVDRASLDPLTANLSIFWADGSPVSELHLADNQDPKFASVLHERVQSSVVLAETMRLPSGQIVRVAVRRDANGGLFSQVIGPGTIPLHDPKIVALIDAAETRVRDACGLPL